VVTAVGGMTGGIVGWRGIHCIPVVSAGVVGSEARVFRWFPTEHCLVGGRLWRGKWS